MVTRLGITVVEAIEIVQTVTAKFPECQEVSFHPAFQNILLTRGQDDAYHHQPNEDFYQREKVEVVFCLYL